MKYISIDDAINEILKLGPGTLLAKIDIKNAFRLIPVYPADSRDEPILLYFSPIFLSSNSFIFNLFF